MVGVALGLALAGSGRAPAHASAPTSTSQLSDNATPAPVTPGAPITATLVDVVILSGQSVATATTNLNVRSGPGVAYPLLGYLAAGQSTLVTGLNADWLQIVYQPAGDGHGWVSRRYVAAGDLSGVPVVAAPRLAPSATPTPTPSPAATQPAVPPPITDWQGEYFDNFSLNGPPRLVRNDVAIDFNWSGQSPVPGLPVENFSARWTRMATFNDGTYHFTLEVDDGARLWVDGNLVIDQWHDSQPTTYASDVPLGAGPHQLRLEYYQHLGTALVRLSWHRPEDWSAEYFNNRKLDGDPVLKRYEDELSHDWGQGSPDPAVSADNFSARWTRQAGFHEDTYTFTVDADDGVRLWVDGQLLIDDWQDGNRTRRADRHFDDDGEHSVRVEYYEHWGGAHIKVSWQRK